MSGSAVDIAVIGAGPYGLSLAAHLRHGTRSVRIFGAPMGFWSQHMPRGMCLKSEGFASDLYDPQGRFTLRAYCSEKSLPYADIGLPVRLENFIAYGREFQRRYVPQMENIAIAALARRGDLFELTLASGEVALARRVVIAAGILPFARLPPQLEGLSPLYVTHSSAHSDLAGFKDRCVAVIGAGASALDLAALLCQAGAQVQLVARRASIAFHDAPREPRPLIERLKSPRSGLGIGWRSRLCTDVPDVFHALPQLLRFRAVDRHLGPAPCWFTREAVEGRFPMHLGAALAGAAAVEGRVQLTIEQVGGGGGRTLEVDHVVAGTGFQIALSRLSFIDPPLRALVRTAADTPILNRYFESSVPGLYMIGGAAAYSFGPLLRFAFGAKFTARRIAPRLLA